MDAQAIYEINHNTIIFSRCKTTKEREYYLKLTASEKLNKGELERQTIVRQLPWPMTTIILSG